MSNEKYYTRFFLNMKINRRLILPGVKKPGATMQSTFLTIIIVLNNKYAIKIAAPFALD